MDTLLVGDVHAVVEELGDCEALMKLVLAEVKNGIGRVVFMGDQHHTHAVVRVEILAFWRRWLRTLTGAGAKVVLLKGNHDAPNDASSKVHSLMAYEDMEGVAVVDQPTVIDGVLCLPYLHSPEEFLATPYQQHRWVICHQTFQGATYENGIFAPEGVVLPPGVQTQFISGHIHTPQVFGPVEYIGAPRWRTVADANTPRHLHRTVWGQFEKRELVSTAGHCRSIETYAVAPDAAYVPSETPNTVRHVTIRGPQEFVAQQAAKLSTCPNVRVRAIPDEHRVVVRESEGIRPALERFLASIQTPLGTKGEVLLEMARERVYV